ncbi:hypothetical protein, partial [Streptomyces virginiae]|uniref:hypothetical protein n=1 Tax=Streptomyces virginiae TaxID=1961 RepID=UPI0033209CB0
GGVRRPGPGAWADEIAERGAATVQRLVPAEHEKTRTYPEAVPRPAATSPPYNSATTAPSHTVLYTTCP